MDVRCDKCGTEYELDEARLKPGGVTIKCTSCGNLFRVQKRGSTAVGLGVVGPTGSPSPALAEEPAGNRAKTASGAMTKAEQKRSEPAPQPSGTGDAKAGKERTWLVRLPTGQVESCHELATLQQWIISGRVSRNSGITRTGKTWKKLGDIAELASFFEIAEQARQARHERSAAVPMPGPPGHLAAPSQPIGQPEIRPVSPPIIRPTIQPGSPGAGARDVPTAPRLAPAATPVPLVSAESTEPMNMPMRTPAASPGPLPLPGDPAVAPPSAAVSQPRSQPRESNGWPEPGPGEEGPKGGLARGVPTMDVAFGKSRIKPLSEPEGRFDDRDPLPTTARGGVGRWIAIVSLLVMAGAAAAIYLLVFRAPGKQKGASSSETPASVLASGTQPGTTPETATAAAVPDAGVPDAAPAGVSEAEVLADANKSVLSFDKAALEEVEPRLAALEGAADKPELLLAQARVHTALAQHARDEAALASDNAKAKELARDADRRVLLALPMVKKALEKKRDDVMANVLMADITRLQGKRSRDVDRYLRVVRKKNSKDRDADLIQALGYVAEKRLSKARPMLEKLERGDGAMEKSLDARPTYRLAMIDFSVESHEDARRRVNAILTWQPEHKSAQALLARIRQATEVDTSDPLPPEDKSGSGDNSSDNSYQGLLARADRKAENGDCKQALDLYDQAVDINPLGVAALTGMGYCYIDRQDFSSAHAKFKAALVAAPNYPDALWGIAEAHQQAGKTDLAIEAFKKYLSAHPNDRRADMAKRQIERMGGSVDGSANTPDPGTGDTPGGDDTKTGTDGTPGGDTKTGTGGTPGGDDTGTGTSDKPAGGDTGTGDKPAGGDTGTGDKPAGGAPTDKSGDASSSGETAPKPGSGEPAGAADGQ